MPDFVLKGVEFTELLQYLNELGWFKNSGEVVVPIEWSDIKAWSDVTETKISAWEAVTLIEMSNAYTAWRYKAKDVNCKCP
jgi:hypothetical protein